MPCITDPIDRNLIPKICKLPDDVYRNQWITFVYDDLSRIAEITAGRSLVANRNTCHCDAVP